jgi:hypothetical protein
MATVNVSVTESITISPDDLVGGTPVTYSIDNPLGYSSYVALETTRNADGFYDSTSPQNISGSFSLGNGIIDVVNDNYKVGVIVASGGGVELNIHLAHLKMELEYILILLTKILESQVLLDF